MSISQSGIGPAPQTPHPTDLAQDHPLTPLPGSPLALGFTARERIAGLQPHYTCVWRGARGYVWARDEIAKVF